MLKINSLNFLFLFLLNTMIYQKIYTDSMSQTNYSIVFVHVGNKFPDYLVDALEQARLFNQESNIIVVGNQIAFENNICKERFQNQNIVEITCESLPETEAHVVFKKSSRLDKQFRDGFWNKTTERFFYLHKVMHIYGLNNVFHLENDNMLYTNLENLLPIFLEHYPNMANVFESDARSIPSFIFIRNQSAIASFVTFIASNAHKGIDDMHIIAQYKNQVGNKCTDHLPVIPKEYTLAYPLRNQVGQKASNPTMFYRHISEFNSVFDGAAYGQFLGGIDPRNGPSNPGFINESAFFNPSLFNFEWIQDEQGRKVPHIKYGDCLYRINNLHIHCKKLNQFRS